MIRRVIIVILATACVITVLLGALSSWTTVDPRLLHSGYGFEFAGGELAIHYRYTIDSTRVGEWSTIRRGFGFEYRRQCFCRGSSKRYLVAASIAMPASLAAIALGAYPIMAFYRGPLRRYRRRQKGLCPKCGYNLTGNVSGVCPECGMGLQDG